MKLAVSNYIPSEAAIGTPGNPQPDARLVGGGPINGASHFKSPTFGGPPPNNAPKSNGTPPPTVASPIILLFANLLWASNGPGTLLPNRFVACDVPTKRLNALASRSSVIHNAGGEGEQLIARTAWWQARVREGMQYDSMASGLHSQYEAVG